MNKITTGIWNNRNKITLLFLLIMVFFFWKQCKDNAKTNFKNKQNQKALKDSLEFVRLQNGDLITQKAMFIANEKELKELSYDLYEQLHNLKLQKSEPKVIIKTVVQYKNSGETTNTVSKLSENEYSLLFDYLDSDSVLSINGSSTFKVCQKFSDGDSTQFKLDVSHGVTKFDSVKVKFGLVMGVKKDTDGVERVFANPQPNTNKISVLNIDAVQVEDYYKNKYNSKPKKVSVGPYIGVGLNVSTNGRLQIVPQMGIGVQYSFFKF